jgi:predicted alpha/beta-hydrolase family hydrolase
MLAPMAVNRLFLAPGASGSVERLAPHVDGLRRRGIDATAVVLPKGKAERAVPAYRRALAEAEERIGEVGIGGHSYGGRVASLLATEETPAALVLLSYPLHAPGRHEAWDERTAHWPRIVCPVLLLSGTADPFARLDLLHEAVQRLPNARLVTYPGLGHGLLSVLDRALDEVARTLGAAD